MYLAGVTRKKGRQVCVYACLQISTNEVDDDAAVAPPARRLAEVSDAVGRVRAGEHVELRRVSAADDADIAGFFDGVPEAEHGVVFGGL